MLSFSGFDMYPKNSAIVLLTLIESLYANSILIIFNTIWPEAHYDKTNSIVLFLIILSANTLYYGKKTDSIIKKYNSESTNQKYVGFILLVLIIAFSIASTFLANKYYQ